MRIESISYNSTNISSQKFDLEINEIKTPFRNETYNHSILVVINRNQLNYSILFHLMEEEELFEHQIFLIEESGLVFFVTNHQFGIIDLTHLELIEQKECHHFGFLERIKNSIIFDDELYVKSYSIYGEFIGEIPIDPPSTRKEFEDYLEYESPTFGKRKLKIE